MMLEERVFAGCRRLLSRSAWNGDSRNASVERVSPLCLMHQATGKSRPVNATWPTLGLP